MSDFEKWYDNADVGQSYRKPHGGGLSTDIIKVHGGYIVFGTVNESVHSQFIEYPRIMILPLDGEAKV